MNSLILLKKLSLFANCSFNQIPFSYILGLYKEDQATTLTHTHTHPIIHLSHTLLFWNFVHFTVIYTFPYFSISLTKSLFLDNTPITHYYPSLSHSLILKFHHFATHKHLSISLFISLTKSPFLESNIIYDTTQKTTSATTISSCITIFNIHISHTSIYFTSTFLTKYPYILPTYISNISYKHHVLQNIYISYHLHRS